MTQRRYENNGSSILNLYNMNVLCDYHHGELYESLRKVFEVRLGGKLYRPIGREWHDEGYWAISHNEGTIDQFLDYRFSTSGSISGTFVEDAGEIEARGHKNYFKKILSIYDNPPHNTITFEAAKEFPWDIIIATFPPHYPIMLNFQKKFCPKAKYVIQFGNVVYPRYIPEGIQNALNSTGIVHSEIAHCLDYYQEFDTSCLNPQTPDNDGKFITCFLVNNGGHRAADYWKLQSLLPDWTFKEYGVLNKDGNIHLYKDQCQEIRRAAFLWHVKLNGDGYGYTLYRSLYAGKPVILNYGTVYSEHRLAKLGFMKDGETIIDYDGKTLEQIASSLQTMRSNFPIHSENISRRMREIINFDREEQNIRRFIENLI